LQRPGLTLLGVPIDCSGRAGGPELAPRALRRTGLTERLLAADAGDVAAAIRGTERDPESGVLALPWVVATIGAVRDAVADLLRSGAWPLVLAGDCTATIGACAALRDHSGTCGLAYIDGHIDLYDGETSPTGEAADFPLAVICGRGPAPLRDAAGGESPIVDPARVALLGARDLEEAKGLGSLMPEELHPELLFLDADAIREAGPVEAGERAIEHTTAASGGFWAHIDLDALGADEFPATNYLMPGGLTWDQLRGLVRPLVSRPECRGATIACFNPERDPYGHYARRIAELLEVAFLGAPAE
jgi:arginase